MFRFGRPNLTLYRQCAVISKRGSPKQASLQRYVFETVKPDAFPGQKLSSYINRFLKKSVQMRSVTTWTSSGETNSRLEQLENAEPFKDDFVKHTLNQPLFLLYLKRITEQESRIGAFREFQKRCDSGTLTVEKDVYVTKEELFRNMWENGYSDAELHTFQTVFQNSDQKFYYPELAVLFELSEEDCYKFCLRTREQNAQSKQFVELINKPPRSTNQLLQYGLVSVAIWAGMQSNVLNNLWLMVKTWPFLSVIYMIANRFKHKILSMILDPLEKERKIAEKNKVEGEEILLSQIERHRKNVQPLTQLTSLKSMIQKHLHQYKLSLLLEWRDNVTKSIEKYVVAVEKEEQSMKIALHKTIVDEVLANVFDALKKEPLLDEKFTDWSINLLEHGVLDSLDPISQKVKNNLKNLESNQRSPLFIHAQKKFQELNQQFYNKFTLTVEEERQLRKLKKLYRDKSTDSMRLDGEAFTEATNLHNSIFNRLGLQHLIPTVDPSPLRAQEPNDFIRELNLMMKPIHSQLQHAYLERLLRSVTDNGNSKKQS